MSRARGGVSELWKTEDWWAVWFGFLMIAFAIWGGAGKAPKLGTWAAYPVAELFYSTSRSVPLERLPDDCDLGTPAAKNLKYDAERKTLSFDGVLSEPRRDLLKGLSEETAFGTAVDALYAQRPARSNSLIPSLVLLWATLGTLTALGVFVMGENPWKYLSGFTVIFLMTVLAHALAGHETIKAYGLGYAFWALLIGLLISNSIGVPQWLMAGARTEMYIKAGLVLLGAEILFTKILQLGAKGLFVAWAVTPVVLVFMYLFGTRVLKMAQKSLVMVVAAATSVCGVSAAIATAAACRAKKEELTLAVGMTLIFTVLMMIAMPVGIKALDMDPVVGGAWMGGTIDATGAVVAAGSMLGAEAERVAAVVKMIQNVLIGLVAFLVAVYWVTRVDRKAGVRPSPMEIWYRLPKFVIGFVAASLVFSFVLVPLLGTDVVEKDIIKAGTKTVRGWLFCLAFIAIGLQSNFRELAGQLVGGKPIILYLVGQSFNLVLTLVAAYLAFGGILFR